MALDLHGSVSFERLQAPFESASDALARFDERLCSSPVAEAFVLRAHFHDACAALWRAGEFVQIEDLVLHDAGTDVRTPTHELVRAHAVLLTRRRIADREPAWALTTDGLASLRGVQRLHVISLDATAAGSGAIEDEDAAEDEFENEERSSTGEFDEIDQLLARTSRLAERIEPAPRKRDDSGLVYDEDWDKEARLAEWRERLSQTTDLPPLMAAGIALTLGKKSSLFSTAHGSDPCSSRPCYGAGEKRGIIYQRYMRDFGTPNIEGVDKVISNLD